MKKAKRKAQVRKPRKLTPTLADLAQVSSLQAKRIRELETTMRELEHELRHRVLTLEERAELVALATNQLIARVNRLDPAGAPKEYAEQPSGDAAVAAGEPQAGEA